MLIFNHRIIFEETSFLNNNDEQDIFQTIHVKQSKLFAVLIEKLSKSSWLTMSQRQVRYYGNQIFSSSSSSSANTWGLEIKEVMTLIWDEKTKSIYYEKYEKYTNKLLEFWIFHTFLPLQLTLEQSHKILHTSSVMIENKAILFSAFSFGGKSTLTAYFVDKGHQLLADDSIGIVKEKEEYKAIASYPFYRPYREPESLGYRTDNFVQTPSSLQSMYHLKSVNKDAKVSIRTLYGIEKFKVLHHSLFIEFDFLKQKNFMFITGFAQSLSVYEIEIPWDVERLEEVYQAILIHNKV
jgi:hypothetical protein